MKSVLKLGILLSALSAAGAVWAQAPKVGDEVPNFTLQELGGDQVTLSDYDGKVTLCCNDLNAEGVIGALAEKSLYEIFRGPERAEVIRAMREKRRRDLPFCGTCSQV